MLVGLQPTVIASRAPHLLLEQSVMIQRIVDVHRPSSAVRVLYDLLRSSRSVRATRAKLYAAHTTTPCHVCCLPCVWPVARSIFDASLGSFLSSLCERSERADNKLDKSVV